MKFKNIITGDDPRNIDEFMAIRKEIDKINHPEHPIVNWGNIESLSIILFKKNGIDLQTAIYYTLARCKIDALTGFTEGIEIIAALITYQWDNLWPKPIRARVDMLEWLNGRVSPDLRDLTISVKDYPLIANCEVALHAINNTLTEKKITPMPRIVFLLDFMQDTQERLDEEITAQQNVDNAVSKEPEVLIYQPEKIAVKQATKPVNPVVPTVKSAVTVTPRPVETLKPIKVAKPVEKIKYERHVKPVTRTQPVEKIRFEHNTKPIERPTWIEEMTAVPEATFVPKQTEQKVINETTIESTPITHQIVTPKKTEFWQGVAYGSLLGMLVMLLLYVSILW